MITRREFLVTAGTAAFMRRPSFVAAKYDVLIKGARVLDASQRMDQIADVAIQNGKISAVRPNLESDAARVIDARGKIATAGLIDIHVHAADPMMTPSHCLSTGVTALVDAGSRGADNIDDIVRVVKAAPNRVRILINVSRTGLGNEGELLNLENANVDAARQAIEKNRDFIVGVKARLSRTVAGNRDLEALRRAVAVAAPFRLPVMIHIGDTFSPLPEILALLRPGDIVTHTYAPPPHGIFDDKGGILPEVYSARRRGIVFDIGNGRLGHITWDSAELAMNNKFFTDTISSDLTAAGLTDRVFDFPTVLSKFLLLGMPLDQVMARATANAARVFPAFKELGTLRTGAPADVAVFELREGNFEFFDNLSAKRMGRMKLVPVAVISSGKVVTS
jgi:dihydroorotase